MYLKSRIAQALAQAVRDLEAQGLLPADAAFEPEIERPASVEHGDYASNVAMKYAKPARQSPRVIAEALAKILQPREQDWLAGVEIAGPGFINFRLKPEVFMAEMDAIRRADAGYGQADWAQGRNILIEFVSANPTGPLNVVSARAAAVGDALAKLLESQGARVYREYYINDAGRQTHLLGESQYAFQQMAQGQSAVFPEEGYQKDYVKELAAANAAAMQALPQPPQTREERIEYNRVQGVKHMVARHQQALKAYNVVFDAWFSEQTLHDSGAIAEAVDELKQRGFVYEKEGALWFASTRLGDDKDRVLRKADGDWAYLAADIAYHRNKYSRGFTELIDLWGPDHHGYIARVRAAVQALGHDPASFVVQIVQQVNLLENGQPVSMSKRGQGRLIEMEDLLQDVGRDVARFFFLMRSTSAHLDFDLDLARQHTEDNPVFYVQYAHARICSILRKAAAEGFTLPLATGPKTGHPAPTAEETALARELAAFPEILETAARTLEPHGVAFALRDVATAFHRFYTLCRVLDPGDPARTQARLVLADAGRIVLRNGLFLLGIRAPESM